MEVRAVAKFVRVQPRKVRQIAREVRGKNAVQMAHVLGFQPGKGAFTLRKVLISAISNAGNNNDMDIDTLKIKEIKIDEGPKIKRIQARAMGRANRIFKRMSHITVVVEDIEETGEVKPHGTKAKARPKLADVKGRKKAEAKPATPVVEEVAEVEEVTKLEEGTEEVKAEETTAEVTEAVATEGATPESGAEEKKD
jgi:large subunit ribosomal protein L22